MSDIAEVGLSQLKLHSLAQEYLNAQPNGSGLLGGAISPESRDAARKKIMEAIAGAGLGDKPVVRIINDSTTVWHKKDGSETTTREIRQEHWKQLLQSDSEAPAGLRKRSRSSEEPDDSPRKRARSSPEQALQGLGEQLKQCAQEVRMRALEAEQKIQALKREVLALKMQVQAAGEKAQAETAALQNQVDAAKVVETVQAEAAARRSRLWGQFAENLSGTLRKHVERVEQLVPEEDKGSEAWKYAQQIAEQIAVRLARVREQTNC